MPLDRNAVAPVSSGVGSEWRRPADLPACLQYVCCWAAFTGICTALARRAGLHPRFQLRKNGTLKTRRIGELRMACVDIPSAEAQLDAAFDAFGDDLKHWLIVHRSTRYFVYRTPTFRGQRLAKDARGQLLNGVIDVARTADPRYPVWAPIEKTRYERYLAGGRKGVVDDLARQVVDLLAAVYGNLVQGGERDDEESSADVVEHALLLLSGIVSRFLPEERGS